MARGTEDRTSLWPAARNPRVERFFRAYVRRSFAKKFHAVRFAPGSGDLLRALDAEQRPVIVAMNHSAWWDPLVGVLLAGATPSRANTAPMELAQLEQFAFFRKLGIFGIDPEHPGAIDAMTRYCVERFRVEHPATLWLTPQGEFADVRTPARLRPGAAAIAARAEARVVTLAVEYGFWTDQRPECFFLLRDAEPPEDASKTTAWHRALTRAMRSAQGDLAQLVMTRDPASFELRPDLIGGKTPGRARVNPLYDLWLRLRGKSGRVTPRQLAEQSEATPGGRRVILTVLLGIGLFACALALVMTIVNLRLYAAPTDAPLPDGAPKLTVCVPARNEETNIAACVRSLLASGYADLEVLVYDDASDDRTSEILRELASEDSRVRAAETEPLPEGWNGKQHACDRMGRQATGDWLLFTDADVRFEKGCLERTMAEALSKDVALVSTFPRQITGTLGEALVVPMIFFILLGYLPLARMRSTTDPGASAGCGQFLCARKDAWLEAGGHAAFKDSMHDGIKLPRALRRLGHKTDLFDGTDLCACRMYEGFAQTWRGFAKNAYEGLGSVGLLTFITVLHACGHVLPWIILIAGAFGAVDTAPTVIAGVCVVLALAQRVMLRARFRQPWSSVLLHPVCVTLMTSIQWHSLYLAKTGKRTWRGRTATA